MDSDNEELCKTFVQMWSEAVIRLVQRVREVRAKAAVRSRNYGRMEDWSPTLEDLAADFRAQWAEEQTLVWAAYQLERWAKRLAKAQHQDPPPPDKVLADLRHALEHLDEAEFTSDGGPESAVPRQGTKKNWSLRALPSSRLEISMPGGTGSPAFGLINVEELERRAETYVRQIDDEMMDQAESWWIEMNSDR